MFKNQGALIRQSREKSGLTQGELSQKLGFTNPQFVSNWEREQSGYPNSAIKQLSKLLSIDKKDLIEAKVKDFYASVAKDAR